MEMTCTKCQGNQVGIDRESDEKQLLQIKGATFQYPRGAGFFVANKSSISTPLEIYLNFIACLYS